VSDIGALPSIILVRETSSGITFSVVQAAWIARTSSFGGNP